MEGMEALRQLATTSLLMQGAVGPAAGPSGLDTPKQMQPAETLQPQPSTSSSSKLGNNRVVPIIQEPTMSLLDGQ